MQRCALCWPCISWDIIFTPGADLSAEIDYVNPYIPSPLRANIGVNVQLNDFIFISRDNPCVLSAVPSSVGFTSLRTTQYQDMVVFADIAKQIQKTYNTIKDEHKRRDHFAEMIEQEVFVERDPVLFSTNIPHDRERENSFVELAELISTEMYYANRFQADILKHINPSKDGTSVQLTP
jgi:hypothetical protein